MTDELRSNRSRPLLALGAVVVVVVVGLSLPAGRALVGRFFRSLRMQKVQAVNVDLSSFTDPNANPALHQMVAQMISDKVVVTVNENDQPATDAAGAAKLAGFPVQLLGGRKDPPKLIVSGAQSTARVCNLFSPRQATRNWSCRLRSMEPQWPCKFREPFRRNMAIAPLRRQPPVRLQITSPARAEARPSSPIAYSFGKVPARL